MAGEGAGALLDGDGAGMTGLGPVRLLFGHGGEKSQEMYSSGASSMTVDLQ